MSDTTPEHLTSVNRDAQNPQGQRHTMDKCAVGNQVTNGPGGQMHSTVETVISPTSNIGTTKTTPS